MKTISDVLNHLTSESIDKLYFLFEEFRDNSLNDRDKQFFEDVLDEIVKY